MSIFTAIGAGLGLLKSNDTAASLAKDISSGADLMFLTKEEKIQYQAEVVTTWLDQLKALKDSEALRSITRRWIAISVVFNMFALIWFAVWVEFFTGKGWLAFTSSTVNDITFTNFTWSILKIAAAFQLGWAFATIIVFYFGVHLIQHFRAGKRPNK